MKKEKRIKLLKFCLNVIKKMYLHGFISKTTGIILMHKVTMLLGKKEGVNDKRN